MEEWEDTRGGDKSREVTAGESLWIAGRALAFTLSEVGAIEVMEQRRMGPDLVFTGSLWLLGKTVGLGVR